MDMSYLRCLFILSAVFMAWAPVTAQKDTDPGNRAFEEGRFADAVRYYEQSPAEKKTTALYINLGHAHARLKQWEQAIESYQKAIELEKETTDPELFGYLGQAQYMAGRYEKALATLREMDTAKLKREYGILMSRCLIELGQWSRAQNEIIDYLKTYPGNVEALELLAHIFMRSDKPTEAVAVYRDLIEKRPEQIVLHINLAQAQMAAGYYGTAIDTLEFARRTCEGPRAEANRLLADLYIHEKMYREAAACYSRLITSAKKPTAEDYYRLGYCYFQTRQMLSAEGAFGKAVQTDPNHVKAALYLGHVAVENGQIQKSLHYYHSAVRIDPSSPEPHLAIAELEMKNKHYDLAAEHFTKAIDLGQRSVVVMYNQVLALKQADQREMALAALKRALAIYPSDERLKGLLAR